jgi:hypothetical protein
MMGGVIIGPRPEAGVQSRPKAASEKCSVQNAGTGASAISDNAATVPEKVRDAELG